MFFDDYEEKYGKHVRLLGIKTPNKSNPIGKPESQASHAWGLHSIENSRAAEKRNETAQVPVVSQPPKSQTPLTGIVAFR